MLIGSFAHTVDAKGRMFIPSKWRFDLGDTIIVTRGILAQSEAKCLFGMSLEKWHEFAAKFAALPETDVMAQAFRRMMFSNAADCDMDKQGRILIPNSLREYARDVYKRQQQYNKVTYKMNLKNPAHMCRVFIVYRQ